jgi:hypothetical protein
MKILNDPNPLDVALAAEWEKFQRQHSKHASHLEPSRRSRCELAVRRSKIIKELNRIIKEVKNPHQQDEKIQAVWSTGKSEMQGSVELSALHGRIKLALFRLKAWERLEKVVKTKDVAHIRAAYKMPELPNFASYPPVAAIREEIEELVRLATWLDDLRSKLENADTSSGLPLTHADLKNLKLYGATLEQFTKDAVIELLNQRLWPAVNLSASTSPPRIVPGPVPMAKVRWTWNGMDLISWFEVATATGPLNDPAAAARDRISKCRPADHAREGGGRLVVLGSGLSVTVTIWPVLDLEWVTLHGPPIHIGPIRTR